MESHDRVVFTTMESKIVGTMQGGNLHVTDIQCSGEGSGTIMFHILAPALEKSTGELVAVCVWEGGDSIDRIIVKDGKVMREDIEL